MLSDEWMVAVRPALSMEDNTAAIYLGRNEHVGQMTKHVQARHHFIREHYPKYFFPLYISTDDNEADQMTKWQLVDLYQKHSYNVQKGALYIYKHLWELVGQMNDGSYLLRGKKKK